ncbi:response regulator [Clostridium swellfunianum]|uniref:response regulator transcription factor n=1 Tax=Clostridium swellfunianum TaxID=1367462 RepID=UPI00202F6095|nr:response regulator [Clostridium swellfunianum]MCM0649973.1 response regulator [Clostridium swellfunianum]
MYKVVIIDDEKWIIEGLKTGVDWNKYGFEVVGDAENGIKGLEILESYKPELVFTDIRMPGFNGLELIKKAKEKLPDSLFVILSGYAEFAYAQKAISYGIFDYCLKPFEIDDITELLDRASLRLSSKNNTQTYNPFILYEAICTKDIDNIRSILLTNEIIPDNKRSITPLVSLGKNVLEFVNGTKHISFKINTDKYGYLVYGQSPHNISECLLTNQKANIKSIGLGFAVSELSEIETSLETASIASYGVFFSGKFGIYKNSSLEEAYMNTLLSDISDSLKRKDRLHFINSIETLRIAFHEGYFNIKTAYIFFNLITYLSCSDILSKHLSIFDDYEDLYKQFNDVNAMIDYLKENTLTYFSDKNNDKYSLVEHGKIKEILKHINENLTKDISVTTLASKFYINPNYMCSLFKKEVGETIIEYISKRRIDYACKLLHETELPISDISEKCGFHDYFYFTKVFKKFNHTTPSIYRNKARGIV